MFRFKAMFEKVKKIPPSSKAKLKVKGWVDKTRFVESIIVGGRPAFLMMDTDVGKASVEYRILTSEGEIRPLRKEEMGYIPFEFTIDEIKEWNSEMIGREALLDRILEVVQQYADMSFRDQILLTGDIFLTYCMEWTSTTHFLFFVGDRGSGKTNSGQIVGETGYRCMMAGQMSHANIYNFLGTDEEGVGCICEDEAQDLDNDVEKMRIYKSAYAKGRKIPKIDMTGKPKIQVYYNTYCMVFFSGESLPEDKGLMERTVAIHMLKGNPKDNIKRPKDKKWKEEHIPSLRKKLLFWKLKNIGKEFPRINSGLSGRDQELFEDYLSIFAGTKYEKTSRCVVQYYVMQRQQQISESLEAIIFRILEPHIMENKEIEFLCVMEILGTSAELSGNHLTSYYLDQPYFGDTRLTKNLISKILLEKFGAKKEPRIKVIAGKKKQTTYYRFDEKTVKILSEKYHINDF